MGADDETWGAAGRCRTVVRACTCMHTHTLTRTHTHTHTLRELLWGAFPQPGPVFPVWGNGQLGMKVGKVGLVSAPLSASESLPLCLCLCVSASVSLPLCLSVCLCLCLCLDCFASSLFLSIGIYQTLYGRFQGILTTSFY